MNKLATMKIEFIVPTREPITDDWMDRLLTQLDHADLEYQVNHFVRAILSDRGSKDLEGLLVKVRYDD